MLCFLINLIFCPMTKRNFGVCILVYICRKFHWPTKVNETIPNLRTLLKNVVWLVLLALNVSSTCTNLVCVNGCVCVCRLCMQRLLIPLSFVSPPFFWGGGAITWHPPSPSPPPFLAKALPLISSTCNRLERLRSQNLFYKSTSLEWALSFRTSSVSCARNKRILDFRFKKPY